MSKQYDDHDMNIAIRLSVVEERLQNVQSDIQDHRNESEKRSNELKELISSIVTKLETSSFRWNDVFNAQNIKIIGYIILALSGAAGAAKALL